MSIKLSRRPTPDFTIVESTFTGVIHNIFAARGIKHQSELELQLKNLLPISSLGNINQAVELLFTTINLNKKIIIVADFDADGATACALMIRALRQLQANVSYKVPNRTNHGYGLSVGLVKEIINLQPDLIITVDNGVSSLDGIKLARENDIDVLVTDHHLPADTLPDANVIVNPNLKGESFKSKNLCGVGVAFYLICALHKELENTNWYKNNNLQPIDLTNLLELVALGTVADVVPLDKNNRILIQAGLNKIKSGSASAGINALFKIANKEPQYALASDIAFKIAPRINAAGRMEDMSIGIECLLTNDESNALKLASMLNQINIERRETEAKMQDEARQIVNNFNPSNDLPFGLCLYQDNWHEGVVGIVAGRLKEKLHRPTIVFAKSGDMLKGSARSVLKVNIKDVLDDIDKQNPGLIDKFGGHAMAAGLTIKPDKFETFAKAFATEIKSHLTLADLSSEILSDGKLSDNELTLAFAKQLQDLSPWGQQFPEPIFDGKFQILDQRIVGEKHLKMIIKPQNSNTPFDAIAFSQAPLESSTDDKLFEMAYRLDINRWRNNVSLQIMVLHIF